jgi:hypothetical protein
MNKNPSRLLQGFILSFLIGVNVSSFAQESPCKKKLLIEINYDAFGMLAPQGQYLYFRACENGVFQYEVEGSSSGVREMRTKNLTDSQLSSLRGMLASTEIRALRGTYDSRSKFRDYRLTLSVRIPRPQSAQTFVVLNVLSDAKESFPPSILELFCAIDKLRDVDFKVSNRCSL